MASVLERLRNDHKDFSVFLNALEAQVNALERFQEIDYDIVRGVGEYFKEYADPVHHPLEDAVLEVLRKRAPAEAAKVGALELEHERLDAELAVFTGAIEAILHDEELPRDQIIGVIRRFVEDQRLHMKFEEELFFTLAEQRLTDADWTDVERVFADSQTGAVLRGPGSFDPLRAAIAAAG